MRKNESTIQFTQTIEFSNYLKKLKILGQTELTSIQLKLINMTGDLPNLTINNQTMEECITLSCCCPFLGGKEFKF